MKIDETDPEQSFFEPVRNPIDTSVGYLLVGMGVILVFLVVLFSLNQVQSVPNRVAEENVPSTSDVSTVVGNGVPPSNK